MKWRSVYAFGKSLEAQKIGQVKRRDLESIWVGARVMVNGREDRRVGCVVSNNAGYFIFDLDQMEADEGDEGDEGDQREDTQMTGQDGSFDIDDSMSMDEDTFQR